MWKWEGENEKRTGWLAWKVFGIILPNDNDNQANSRYHQRYRRILCCHVQATRMHAAMMIISVMGSGQRQNPPYPKKAIRWIKKKKEKP
jgi:hypothetical protein